MIVVDTSAVVAVIGNAAERERLIERTLGQELIAPSSVHWEIGNALSAMLKRKRISLSDAMGALASYEKIELRFVDIPLSDALEWSEKLLIYAYDAYIIAVAVSYRSPILTLDRGLARVADRSGVEVLEV